MKVKSTILESNCISGYHKTGDIMYVEDLCPPLCHELWQCIYPNIFALLHGGTLDTGNSKTKSFRYRCPDEGRVLIKGELIE
ncbi:MAG: TIGR04076 family protein [Spirochaetia bacterium]|nr:TIGR04076 family protein [Spirochaetia bacterium]